MYSKYEIIQWFCISWTTGTKILSNFYMNFFVCVTVYIMSMLLFYCHCLSVDTMVFVIWLLYLLSDPSEIVTEWSLSQCKGLAWSWGY
jgi:hypothetical protein